MARLKDVAELAGVDISTVSKVLQKAHIRVSSETRERIEQAARELRYQPNRTARSLRTRKSGAIALALPNTSNYLFPEIIDGAEDAAETRGYVLFLVKYGRDDAGESLLTLVSEGRVDGLLLADVLPSEDFVDRLELESVPYVLLNRESDGDGEHVALDDDAGFGQQAKYLAGLGHKNIAFLAGEPESFVTRNCQKAFRRALEECGLELPPERVRSATFEGVGVPQAAAHFMGLNPRPSAIGTTSIVSTALLIEELRGMGVQVPQEVSVIGYHDAPIAQWSRPAITTVKMPSRVQGRRGVERLLDRIAGNRVPGEILREPAPVILERGSCASYGRE